MPQLITFVSQTGNVMKTTLAAATAIELVKQEIPVLAVDIDKEHRKLGSLATWAEDRKQLQPNRDQLTVKTRDDANAAFEKILASNDDTVIILDCPSRASKATKAVSAAADLVVFPIVPGKKDAHLSLSTIHWLIEPSKHPNVSDGDEDLVDPKRIAIVLTRCMTAYEVSDLKQWLKDSSPYSNDFTIISPALMEKPSYRKAIGKGLAITEAQPFSLQLPARAVVNGIIDCLTTTVLEDAAA